MKPAGPASWNTRWLLLAGFGGLLLLMALAGLDDLRVLRSIQSRNDAIRNDFLERNRLLNQIRSDLYLSGTWVRDYVLEPDPAKAESYRATLAHTRSGMESTLQAYAHLANEAEADPFRDLRRQLSDYWRVLDPVMHWDAGKRRAAGYAFLRDDVYPRRTAMVGIADQIGTLNEHQLNSRILQVTALFAGFRLRVAVLMLVTLGIGALLAAFSTRRILDYERAAGVHLSEMEQARSELKELSTRLVEVQEGERRAISRELHDDVGQTLSALLVTLGNMGPDIPVGSAASLQPHLTALRSLAETSLRAVRGMALQLRPSMLDDLGLLPALQWQGREVTKRAGMAVSIDAEGVPEDLPDEYRTSIYRVVQEALHNCEQHAEASTVRVTLRVHANSLALSVQDDGRGFNPAAERGMGLLGMQERIANLGGTFNVESQAGRGALIMVRLPLPV